MRGISVKVMVFALLSSILMPLSVGANSNNEERLLLLLNTRQYYHNGSMYLAQAPHLVKDGVTYVSMRSLAERIGYTVTYDPATNEYAMQKGEHKLSFKLKGKTYRYNGQTKSIRSGEIHTLNGSLMIPLRETVSPLNMSIIPNVKANKIEIVWKKSGQTTPPPATNPLQVAIQLDKQEYKIGENITYSERISGGSGKIASKVWKNNEPVYFSPGRKTVTLEVKDANGQIARAQETFVITNEVFRTEEQYDAAMTPIGNKMAIDGDEVLNYPMIPYDLIETETKLIRSNSPEKITKDGIYYEDTFQGEARIFIHNQNMRSTPARIYLVAQNVSDTPATVELRRLGMGGPNLYISTGAKQALVEYYNDRFVPEKTELAPGELKIIGEDRISKPMPTQTTVSTYADVYSDQEIQYQVVVLDQLNEFDRVYPYLKGLSPDRDGRHIRGTFEKGDRTLTVNQRIGDEYERFVIGDGKQDAYVTGYDKLLNNEPEINYGNFGVMYTLEFKNVAPNTAIVLNPRGGHYAGTFLINGQIVHSPNAGTVGAKYEAGVLYRSGNRQENVTIQFSPAAGSNLPVNLVMIPLDDRS